MKITLRDQVWAVVLTAFLALGALTILAQPLQQSQSEQRQGPIKPKQQKEEDESFTLRVGVPIINMDVTVMDRHGNFVDTLQREHFRVYVDKKEVEVTAFAPSEAPITTVILLEANPNLGYYIYNNLEAVALFLRQLKKEDWLALVSYDMKPHIENDFTQDEQEILQSLRRLQYPAGFRESNFYDALLDTVDRIKDVEGRKSILYIGRGIDTFSKVNWDDTRKVMRENDAVFFAIGMTWLAQLRLDQYEARGGRGASIPRMQLTMAEAQLKNLARRSGGQAYFPRFQGELPNIYNRIGTVMRHQYSLAIRPGEIKRDGKFHKIKIKLVNPLNGEKLKVVDQNKKNIKYKVHHREGFYAPKG